MNEWEWERRQAELAKEQQEKFRREQERLERERQARAAASRGEIVHLFEMHEQQWSMLGQQDELVWSSFPWPVLRAVSSAGELTEGTIGAYIESPYHGDSNSLKERIKEHIRRWHPDRFDTRLLPKVVERERDAVKEGARTIYRILTAAFIISERHDFRIGSMVT